MATDFNDCVAIDLKYWKPNLWILHMVDVFSRFTQSVFITSKKPRAVIDAILTNLQSLFENGSRTSGNKGLNGESIAAKDVTRFFTKPTYPPQKLAFGQLFRRAALE